MDDIGAVYFQSADKSKLYGLLWNETSEIALLSGGAMQIRQDGAAYTLNRYAGTALVTASQLPLINPTDLALNGPGLIICVNLDKNSPLPSIASSGNTTVQEISVPISLLKAS